MANVLLRSPYYISQDIGTDLSAKIEITIDSVLAYTIVKNKPSNSNFVLFEIAELVRDYIDIKYNGSITPSDLNVNVSYVLNKYPQANAGGDAVNLGTTTFFGVDGYGYFEEGSNPSVTQGYMQSNDITSSLTEVFHYTDAIDSFKERVVEDSGTYEESSCIDSFIDSNSLYSVDEIILETEGTELITNIDVSSTAWYKGGDVIVSSLGGDVYRMSSADGSGYVTSQTITQALDNEQITISAYLKGSGTVVLRLCSQWLWNL